MAEKKNKSRVVIWTIVGILVVIAVVFLVLGRGNKSASGRNISSEDVPGFLTRMEGRMEKFERRLSGARDDYGDAEVFDEIDALLENVRVGMDEIQQLTEAQAIEEKMEQIKVDYNEAKQLLKEAT